MTGSETGPETGPGPGAGAAKLRYGWTTGACATAATTAAYQALLTGEFPDPVTVHLPGGQTPAFALAVERRGAEDAMAGVVKDAGDDPDVTHGALIRATVRHAAPGSGVTFRAGPGVGTVTLPGLPLAVGEPAVNPVPRTLIREAVARVAGRYGGTGDVVVELSVDDGAEIARQTWNPRLGILGGLSILGTTGIVIPYSCSAWIDSIRRGIDVAVATGETHVLGATGTTSERVGAQLYGLSGTALLDMGDFAGALLKYLRRHPIPRLTVAGGFAKLSKLADGRLDLHSGRSRINLAGLAERALRVGASADLADRIRAANTALHALELARAEGVPLGDAVAEDARDAARDILRGSPIEIGVDVVAIDRGGTIVGRAGVVP
ncbi:cobalt-precorrin-5B (C(1))-methyltransferase [Streptomyces sp. SID3343]|uniref:cobalt-precorrin-5B (C(1))-methyltransferase n=1 Tax=Streptomyces sp. SID3343 TaxID=2690260 RepID=UPI0013710C5B|nr:cobalt-precorrin-5B (C(1))-methyltransferase [Streptomyces sp. SID3343]MYV99352.1 cobalt-precorrin-5B (C(1))-methyltransferase [Streptomyces sp. SID3343]